MLLITICSNFQWKNFFHLEIFSLKSDPAVFRLLYQSVRGHGVAGGSHRISCKNVLNTPPPRGLGVCTPPFNITMGVLYKYNFYHAETHTGVSQYTHYLTPPSYSFPLQGGAILPMLDLPPPTGHVAPPPI